MIYSGVIANPAFLRAVVVGLFGGAGLVLATVYSRRGPVIYPVYAAILAALVLLLSRYPALSYTARFVAALAAFLVASAALYVSTVTRSRKQLQRLVAEGKIPASVLDRGISIRGHAWRWAFLTAVGSVVGAGVAFLAE